MITTEEEFRALSPSEVQNLIENRAGTDEDQDEYYDGEWAEWGVGETRQFGGLSMVMIQQITHSDEVSAIFVIASPQDGYTWSVRYFRKQGYYNSYESLCEWDGDVHEVRPHQETVTVWREVSK